MKLPNKKYQIIYADPPWKYDSGFLKRNWGKKYKHEFIEIIEPGTTLKDIQERISELGKILETYLIYLDTREWFIFRLIEA